MVCVFVSLWGWAIFVDIDTRKHWRVSVHPGWLVELGAYYCKCNMQEIGTELRIS